MDIEKEKMLMACHHAKMYIYDNQLANIYMLASQIYKEKARLNYQIYLHNLIQNDALYRYGLEQGNENKNEHEK